MVCAPLEAIEQEQTAADKLMLREHAVSLARDTGAMQRYDDEQGDRIPACALLEQSTVPDDITLGQRMTGTTPSVTSAEKRPSTTAVTLASICVSWAAGSFSCR